MGRGAGSLLSEPTAPGPCAHGGTPGLQRSQSTAPFVRRGALRHFQQLNCAYFETDRLNMRSSFSLVASTADWAAWAAARA